MRSPFALAAIVAAATLAAEVLVMLILPSLISADSAYNNIVDGLLLVIILTPVLYYMVYYPFIRQIRKIRESEQKYNAVTQTATDAIISINGAGEIINWNRAAEKMFGYSENEASGKPVGLVIPKRHEEAHRQGLARITAGGPYHLVGKTVTIEGVRKDGAEFPLELSLSAWESGGKPCFTAIIRDISERKLKEDEINVSNENLKRALDELSRFFNLVPDMVCVASTAGYFLKFNSAWEKRLGFTEREMLASPFLDFIHPDDREATMKEVERQVAGKATVEFINRYRCKSGGYRWLEWMATPSPDKQLLYAAARDITERIKTEEALRKSREDFRDIMENSSVPMALTDDEQRIAFLNGKFIETFGYTLADIPTVEEWWPRAYPDPSYREKVRAEWNRQVGAVMREGVDFTPMEAVVVCKDGRRRTITFNFSFIGNRGLTVFHDISGHKAMEDRLRVSEQTLSEAQALAHLGSWELDLQTGKTKWSAELRRMYGIHPEEAEPAFDRFMELIHPDDRKTVEDGLSKTRSGTPPKNEFELRIIRPDGQRRDIIGKLEVVTDKNGNPVKIKGFNLDVTERKLMEAALLRSKKLASIVTLSTGVGHEILNPLNIIGTIAQLLMMKEPQGEIHEKMRSIRDQIQRAVKIIGNLNMFARQNRMEMEEVNLHAIFDQAASFMESGLKAGNIVIERHFDSRLSCIQGDAHALEQVFAILISNVGDAVSSRGHGTITVATRPVEHGIEFKLCDDGPGIPAEIMEKVFDPFFTTKDPGKGTGLGLSMAHRIIEDHGGTISLESEAGKGACCPMKQN